MAEPPNFAISDDSEQVEVVKDGSTRGGRLAGPSTARPSARARRQADGDVLGTAVSAVGGLLVSGLWGCREVYGYG